MSEELKACPLCNAVLEVVSFSETSECALHPQNGCLLAGLKLFPIGDDYHRWNTRSPAPEGEAMREMCKRDVCMYCDGRAIGYKKIPDGPNEAGNWTHQYTATMRSQDRVLCVASAIFARERFAALNPERNK